MRVVGLLVDELAYQSVYTSLVPPKEVICVANSAQSHNPLCDLTSLIHARNPVSPFLHSSPSLLFLTLCPCLHSFPPCLIPSYLLPPSLSLPLPL